MAAPSCVRASDATSLPRAVGHNAADHVTVPTFFRVGALRGMAGQALEPTDCGCRFEFWGGLRRAIQALAHKRTRSTLGKRPALSTSLVRSSEPQQRTSPRPHACGLAIASRRARAKDSANDLPCGPFRCGTKVASAISKPWIFLCLRHVLPSCDPRLCFNRNCLTGVSSKAFGARARCWSRRLPSPRTALCLASPVEQPWSRMCCCVQAQLRGTSRLAIGLHRPGTPVSTRAASRVPGPCPAGGAVDRAQGLVPALGGYGRTQSPTLRNSARRGCLTAALRLVHRARPRNARADHSIRVCSDVARIQLRPLVAYIPLGVDGTTTPARRRRIDQSGRNRLRVQHQAPVVDQSERSSRAQPTPGRRWALNLHSGRSQRTARSSRPKAYFDSRDGSTPLPNLWPMPVYPRYGIIGLRRTLPMPQKNSMRCQRTPS